MKHETAGDPMTGLKWTHRTTAKIATELSSLGITVSDRTVANLLRQMKFSLRVNHKKLARACALAPQERDAQFAHIAELRQQFVAHRLPLISVDTKKKEIVGRFKNPGQAWHREPIPVNDHDFRSDADGMAIPYGIYDQLANRGAVFVGTSHDTPEFAARSIATWWRYEGRHRYAHADRIGILADSGGSNSPTCRAWKYYLHRELAQRYGLLVTVAHYPSGTSKWNPIEHRLFSEISKNWAGRPLDSYDTILNYLRTTTTATGLQVRAHLLRKNYEKGVKISDDQMHQLPIQKHATLPKWNYTISPS